MPFTTRVKAPGPPLTPPEEGDSGLAGEQCDFMMMRHYISNDGGAPLSLGRRERNVGCDEERFISPEESRLRAFGWGEAPYATHDAERASYGGENGD